MLKKAAMMAPPVAAARLVGSGMEAIEHAGYSAGGWATDKGSAAGLPPQAAAALGVGTNLATQLPVMLAGGPVGGTAKPLAQSAGRRVMQMALKPDKAARKSGDAAQAIETLLEKGINVSKGGAEKLTAEIDKLDDALTLAIKNSKSEVSTVSLIKPIKEAIAKFKDGLDHATNTESVKGELLKFFDHPEVQGAFQIPAELAQRIKRGIYREVGDVGYGTGVKPLAEREGKKAVARGLNEGLGRVSPEAAEINAKMGPSINARDLVQDRALAAGNNQLMGLGWLAHPSMWGPWLAERSPLAGSALARLLYSGGLPESAGRLGAAVPAARMGTAPKDEQEKRP
jgi:hypothetical protein